MKAFIISKGKIMSEIRENCKVCNSNITIICHPKFGDYYYCSNCEFISKDESNRFNVVEEKLRYENHNNSIEDKDYVNYFCTFIKEAVIPFADEGKHGLDFGSGPSPVLAQILEQKFNYQMDIYDHFFSPEKVFIGKKYDLITSTEVVEHLNDPLYYFSLFSKLLKSKGVLAIMTNFHRNNEDHFLSWSYIRDVSHISFYTSKTMEYIASKVGLKIIYTNNDKYISFMLDR